jgi:hypothetical protein
MTNIVNEFQEFSEQLEKYYLLRKKVILDREDLNESELKMIQKLHDALAIKAGKYSELISELVRIDQNFWTLALSFVPNDIVVNSIDQLIQGVKLSIGRIQKDLDIGKRDINTGEIIIKPLTKEQKQLMILSSLEAIFTHFHVVVRQLRDRYNSRPTLDVKDEFDVQDLMNSLLRIYFNDIRKEEWTPSYAGGSSRMDFLLKNEKIVIEVKKTRDSLRDKQIGEQLLTDIARYKEHQDCQTLVCFVYDPEGYISNPTGLVNDLNKLSNSTLKVEVYISPNN